MEQYCKKYVELCFILRLITHDEGHEKEKINKKEVEVYERKMVEKRGSISDLSAQL